MLKAFENLPTPAYVADVAAIRRNLNVARKLKAETGCTLLLATKAFSMFSLFPLFADVLDGTTASGYYEAKLGHDHFGGEVHAYSPAFTDAEMEQLLPICKHVYFNSHAQLARYGPRFREHWGEEAVIGLRLNPHFSQVTNAAMYDPSAGNSRFGVSLHEANAEDWRDIDLLHMHNLCENMAIDSVALIHYLSEQAGHLLERVRYVNLGGGHYVTHPDYDLAALMHAINELQARFDVQVILEPGGAWVYDAGYLVASVLDIIEHDTPIAVLDTSATCHMPDVLEMPYRPNVIGDKDGNQYTYQLAGRTCLAGDVIGIYHFNHPLAPGDKLIFTDMLQYSMVKNTTFNGVPLPAICALEEDGTCRTVKAFGYADFEERLS